MTINIFNVYYDQVIESWFLNAETTYRYAIENIFPRIGEFDAQRKLQSKKFYQRLRKDIVKGCIMPPITISFVEKSEEAFGKIPKRNAPIETFKEYVHKNISSVYVLDGMQRLNTLKSASEDEGFDGNREILLNILISKSNDKLLYRMITLNNGQRPMTPRHQIEILTKELFDLTTLNNISVQTEKERGEGIVRGSFNYVDISNAYLAFLTNNVHNENTKIIEEKMNEILVGRLFDSEISDQKIEFTDILLMMDKFCASQKLKSWLKNNNNMIGFVVGVKRSFNFMKNVENNDMEWFINNFEEALDSINTSKVNVGKIRRELAADFIGDIENKSKMESPEMMEYIATKTA